jgi:hypothetical protein
MLAACAGRTEQESKETFMRTALISLAILPLLTGGCVMDRFAEVSVDRSRVADTIAPAGLTQEVAVDIFRDVAGRLGFPVEGPKRVSQKDILYVAYQHIGKTTDWKQLTPADRVEISLEFYRGRTVFLSQIHGTAEEFTAAESAALLFEQELKKRGIPYIKEKRKAYL